jgi:hypothetical protein
MGGTKEDHAEHGQLADEQRSASRPLDHLNEGRVESRCYSSST